MLLTVHLVDCAIECVDLLQAELAQDDDVIKFLDGLASNEVAETPKDEMTLSEVGETAISRCIVRCADLLTRRFLQAGTPMQKLAVATSPCELANDISGSFRSIRLLVFC